MDGISKITARISAEATAEVTVILSEADASVKEIAAEYTKSADEEYGKIKAAGEAEAALLGQRLDSAAELKTKKQLLILKQELVALAFDRAVEQLRSLPEDRYTALLTKLAYDASRTGAEKFVFSAQDRQKLGDRVCAAANEALSKAGRPASLSVADKTADIPGGFILSGGNIDVNCTLSALVQQHTNDLTPEVASVLFD